MENVFKTTTGTITLKNDEMRFRRLLEQPSYRAHSFLLFVVILTFKWLSFYNEPFPTNEDKFRLLVWTVLIVYWMYPHLENTFNWLFRFTWKKRIKLDNVVSAESMDLHNELECGVRLKLRSGRVKEVIFRQEEGYAAPFLQLFETNRMSLQ